MKKILATIVLLTGILLAAYYTMGFFTERTLKQNLNAMQSSSKYKVKVVNYKRGFFISKAIINVEIISPARVLDKDGKRVFKPADTYFTSVPLEIHHGPIIFVGSVPKLGLGYAESEISIPAGYFKNFSNKYTSDSNLPTLNLNIFVNFLANTNININSPKFNLVSLDKDSSFEWSNMTSKINANSDLSEINGNLSIINMLWMQDKLSTIINEANSYFKLYKGDYELYLGDSSISIPSVLVKSETTNLIELSNLFLKSNSYISNKLFNSSLQATLDKFYINRKTYQNLTLDLYVRNLDAKTLIDINNKIKRSQNGTDGQRKQAILSVLPALPELLNKGAEIELSDLNVQMQEGNIKGGFILSFPKDDNKNPFYLIQKARGTGRIQISKELFSRILNDLYLESEMRNLNKSEDVDKTSLDTNNNVDVSSKESTPSDRASLHSSNKISELVASGVLVASDDNYVLDIKVVQGRLIINDKPFSMDMLRL